MEGRLVKATVMRLAERDGLDVGIRDQLQERLAQAEQFFDGLGMCLSENGDLLSQWRGYADDARGVSVGFNPAYLTALGKSTDKPGFTLFKVRYEASEHEALVEPTYQGLRKLIDDGALRYPAFRTLLDVRTPEQVVEDQQRDKAVFTAFILRLLTLFLQLYELKTPAFREEQEWRIVSMLTGPSKDACLFRACRGRIVPYRAYELAPRELPAVYEVVLGPKHETPPGVIQWMLRQAGFGDVPVRRSEATYR